MIFSTFSISTNSSVTLVSASHCCAQRFSSALPHRPEFQPACSVMPGCTGNTPGSVSSPELMDSSSPAANRNAGVISMPTTSMAIPGIETSAFFIAPSLVISGPITRDP